MTGHWSHVADDRLVQTLRDGRLTPLGQLMSASNGAVLAAVAADEGTSSVLVVYKPDAAAQPLWDFDSASLSVRETAAFELSQAAGWNCVPPTALRNGPLGQGSVQLWIGNDGTACWGQHDNTEQWQSELVWSHPGGQDVMVRASLPDGWHAVLRVSDEHDNEAVLGHSDRPELRRLALFDVLSNNADRKVAHILAGPQRSVVGIDNALTFHQDPKLRTVLLGFASSSLLADELELLATTLGVLRASLPPALALLPVNDVLATIERVETLLKTGTFPGLPVVGPALPWPPW